jgi:hypothetical protein
MLNFSHPDTHLHEQQVRKITRGSRQTADTAAMEAMFDAITAGKGRKEAETIFIQTYKMVVYGK